MMKRLCMFMVLCLTTLGMFAAERLIKGIIKDEKGEPVIGASIQVKGTTIGTISGYDGDFELSVPEDAKTLVITYVGMKPMEVAIKDNLQITLKEDSEVLEDVVVTGYGNVSKGSFAGSAQTVKAETIEKKAPSEISKALANEVAGVQVIQTTGQPGSNATIRIRGIGSINASRAPLYVVDGVAYDGDISSIDPSDIASTTILKDATATSLYGSRGANGVIVITTKKGNANEEAKITVEANYGANMRLLPMYEVISDPQEYVEMAWQSLFNASGETSLEGRIKTANNRLFSKSGLPEAYNLWNAKGNELINGYTGKFYDDIEMKDCYKGMQSWKNAIFRIGQKAEAKVSISGGKDKTTYYTSFGYLKDEGYYIGSDFDRFSVRSNIEHQAKKWLKGSLNMSYAYTSINNPGQGSNMNNGFAYVNGIPPIYPVYEYNEDGTIKRDPKTGGKMYDYGMHEGYGRGFGSGINPAGALRLDKQRTEAHNVMGVAMLEAKLYKGLTLSATASVQYLGYQGSRLTNKYYGDAAGIGRIYKEQVNMLNFVAQQMLEYKNTFGEHDVDVLAGHETTYQRIGSMYGSKDYIADPGSLEWGNAVKNSYMDSYTTTEALESYFAKASYWYNERYGITANYRADGSSKFAKGHRWGHFGSVGIAWKLTNEEFMAPAKDILKDAKLHFSWGMLGNKEIGSDRFHDMYSIEYSDGRVGYVWSSKGSPTLTWEKTSMFDLGLEFTISKYLDMELTYFHKTTTDCLMPQYMPPSIGYSSVWINGGEMVNQGFEFQGELHAVDMRNIKLNFRFNGGFYRNKITKLPKSIDETNEDMDTNGGLVVGHSMYDYNMRKYAGVDYNTGEAMYVGYYDSDKGGFGRKDASLVDDGDNYISDVDLYRRQHPNAHIDTVHTTNAAYCGSDFNGKSAIPDLEGGFGINFEVYGVTLDITCGYRIGGYGYDNSYAMLMANEKVGNYNWHVDMRNAWTEENRNTNIPRLNNGGDAYSNAVSDRFLTSNSYLSLNNVRLGYKFQKKLIEKIKLSKLELYVQGDNLAIVTARKGYNPIVSATGSSNAYQYTPLSTIMGGIKIQF